MASLDNCFVDRVIEPLQLIDVGVPAPTDPQAGAQPNTRSYQLQFSDLPGLATHFDNVQHTDFACRYISICQRNSWRPLQVTQSMLELVASRHKMGEAFWDLPSCFYSRNLEVEEVFCVPYTEARNDSFVEISYTFKYPEYKSSEDKWSIRQTGVYHRYDTQTSQSLFVLFSPTPNSKAHQAAEEWLLGHRNEARAEPFWLHRILFSTYYPAWRQYLAALERKFLPISNTTFATFINEPLQIGYDNLSELVSIEKRFLQIPAILAPSADTLDELCSLLDALGTVAANHPATRQLKNHRRQCIAYSRLAAHMQQRAQITAQLLSDTLSFRDQDVAKSQNENMLRLNKSAVFITTLTLLYLPASFVASFFGSNFFALDTDGDRIVGTSMIWIFIISAAALTALTFLFYYWLLQRDGAVFRRLEPKVRARTPDWNFKDLTRRLTLNGRNPGIESEKLPT